MKRNGKVEARALGFLGGTHAFVIDALLAVPLTALPCDEVSGFVSESEGAFVVVDPLSVFANQALG